MPFIDGAGEASRLLFGPDEGARALFRQRARYRVEFFVGLHTHQGDESFEGRAGTVGFTVGDERRACRPGEIAFIPAGVEHGFVAETDTVLDIFSAQRMGVYAAVLEPGGGRREEEIFIDGCLSSHLPPPGQGWTPREHVRALYATTRGLL